MYRRQTRQVDSLTCWGDAGIAAHQRESRFGGFSTLLAQPQGGAVPQAQRKAAVEAAKEPFQQLGCLAGFSLQPGPRCADKRRDRGRVAGMNGRAGSSHSRIDFEVRFFHTFP